MLFTFNVANNVESAIINTNLCKVVFLCFPTLSVLRSQQPQVH